MEGNQGIQPHGPCDTVSYTRDPMTLQQHYQTNSIVEDMIFQSNFPEWQVSFSFRYRVNIKDIS